MFTYPLTRLLAQSANRPEKQTEYKFTQLCCLARAADLRWSSAGALTSGDEKLSQPSFATVIFSPKPQEDLMATGSGKGTLHTLYGPALSEAIASGDVAKMSAARDAAFAHLAMSSEVARLLPELEKAIKTKGGTIRPLYGVSIQDAVARGDQAELARMKGEVAYYNNLLQGGPSASAVVPPYGVAIQEAKNRGDQAEIKRLTEWAQSLLDQLNAPK